MQHHEHVEDRGFGDERLWLLHHLLSLVSLREGDVGVSGIVVAVVFFVFVAAAVTGCDVGGRGVLAVAFVR